MITYKEACIAMANIFPDLTSHEILDYGQQLQDELHRVEAHKAMPEAYRMHAAFEANFHNDRCQAWCYECGDRYYEPLADWERELLGL